MLIKHQFEANCDCTKKCLYIKFENCKKIAAIFIPYGCYDKLI